MEPQARGATGAVAPAPLEEKDLPKGASEGGTAGRGAPWGQCPGEAASWGTQLQQTAAAPALWGL